MKKVLIIIESLNGGGAEKVLFDIIKNFDREKYKIELLLLRNEGVYVDKIKKEGIEINYIFEKRKDLFKYTIYRRGKSLLLKIFYYIYFKWKYLKKHQKKYDIEIAFLEGWSTYLLANRRSEKTKKIAWVHIDLKKYRVFDKNTEKNIYLKMNKIICVSDEAKKSMEYLYPELVNKLEVIYNPIPKKEILEKATEENDLYIKNKINLVAVGRLNKQKGYDILLKAHNELLKEGLEYNLYILGEGEERKKLEQYIRDNNIERNTFLLGFKENPYPYIKEADIFISSSKYEGYSLVVAEALCLEKSIIATKCAGPVELLDNGKYGLLAEVESVESLKENMKKLILSEELRKKYSKLSKERSKIFDIDKTMKQIERVLDE